MSEWRNKEGFFDKEEWMKENGFWNERINQRVLNYKFSQLTKDFNLDDWRTMRTKEYWNEIDQTPFKFKVSTKIKYVINYLKNE
jgi:hypothetical protein